MRMDKKTNQGPSKVNYELVEKQHTVGSYVFFYGSIVYEISPRQQTPEKTWKMHAGKRFLKRQLTLITDQKMIKRIIT